MNKTSKNRPYNRKSKTQTITNVDSTDVQLLSENKKHPQDNEIDLLAMIIGVFDGWDSEQRSRNLKYLASRYYDFL